MAKARQFLLQVCEVGLPTATEFLEPFTPQYLGDLISWAPSAHGRRRARCTG